jgi:hypothetical protein
VQIESRSHSMPPNRSRSHGGQKDWIQGPESRRERDRLGLRRRQTTAATDVQQARVTGARKGGMAGREEPDMRVQRLVGRGMQRRKIPGEKPKRNLLGMDRDEIGRDVLPSLGVSGGAAQAGKIGRCKQHRIHELDRAAGSSGPGVESQSTRGFILDSESWKFAIDGGRWSAV